MRLSKKIIDRTTRWLGVDEGIEIILEYTKKEEDEKGLDLYSDLFVF